MDHNPENDLKVIQPSRNVFSTAEIENEIPHSKVKNPFNITTPYIEEEIPESKVIAEEPPKLTRKQYMNSPDIVLSRKKTEMKPNAFLSKFMEGVNPSVKDTDSSIISISIKQEPVHQYSVQIPQPFKAPPEGEDVIQPYFCLLYTSPSPRDS